MKKVKLIVLILLTVVFIAYAMGFLLYRGVNKTVLDQQYYRQVVGDWNISSMVYGEIGDMIPPIVRDGLTGGKTITDEREKAAVDMQVQLISSAITDALNEAWIEEQTVMVTDDVVGLLNREKSSLSAIIDLESKLEEIEQNIAKGLEEFSDEQLLAMFGAPRAYIPMIAEQIVGQLGLPGSLVIADLVNDMAPGTLEMVTGYLGTMKVVFGTLGWVIIAVFLAFCLVLWNIGRGLQWFGITVALSGGLFLGFINFFTSLSKIESMSGADLSSLPVDSTALQGIISFTFSKMNMMPMIFLLGGIALLVIGLFIHRRQTR